MCDTPNTPASGMRAGSMLSVKRICFPGCLVNQKNNEQKFFEQPVT